MQAGSARQTASWRGTATATPPPKTGAALGVYRRHRPETTALYEVVRDNLETLFGAIDDGALAFRIPRQREACPRGMPGRNSSPTDAIYVGGSIITINDAAPSSVRRGPAGASAQ